MRSELVFRAQEKVTSRYLLCQATAKTTRRIHFVSANTTDAINDAFVKIAGQNCLSCQERHSVSVGTSRVTASVKVIRIPCLGRRMTMGCASIVWPGIN